MEKEKPMVFSGRMPPPTLVCGLELGTGLRESVAPVTNLKGIKSTEPGYAG